MPSADAPASILVHGHRGARARLPENTMPGFRYAIESGVDAIELDLAVSKDDVLVVSHEPVLNPPLCSGPRPGAAIRSLTFAEIRQYDCGAMKNPAFPEQQPLPGTPMPALDEVLDLASDGSFHFSLEMKSYPDKPEYTPAPEVFAGMVLEAVRRRRLEARVAVLSFDFRNLAAMRKRAPDIHLSALTWGDVREFAAIACEAARAEIISPHYHLVTPEKVQAAHAAGLKVVVWTANTPSQWDSLIAAKADAIVADDPAALISYLKQRGLR